MTTTPLEQFIYFVNERENIRIRRAEGVPRGEWTKDVILKTHHFCNIRREDDRGTIEIRRVGRTVDMKDLPQFYAMARMFNKASTAEAMWLGGVEAVKEIRDAGGTIFSNAYTVATCGENTDKIDYVDRVMGEVRKIVVPDDSCRSAFDTLRTVSGLGSFMAGQVVADLKNDRYLEEASDWDTFAVIGPGSKKGLDILFGAGTTEKTFPERLGRLQGLTEGKIPQLHAQDLQNCLCEYSKYIKCLTNSPGRRRRYPQPSSPQC